MNKKTITLNTPITRGDTHISSLEMREPLAGDLRGLSLHSVLTFDIDAMVILLPRITQPALIDSEIKKMRIRDITTLAQEVAGFLVDEMDQAPPQESLAV